MIKRIRRHVGPGREPGPGSSGPGRWARALGAGLALLAGLALPAIAPSSAWAGPSQYASVTGGISGREAVRPQVSGGRGAGARLPAAAQGPVSRIIGHDERAYWAVRSGEAVVLSNAAQDLRARFGPDGAVIGADGGWVGLRLAGYGGGRLRAVGAAVPRAQANRVVYQHGAIQERYDNGPLGLEQGFTVAGRPAGDPAGQLTLALALSGNARGSLSAAGGSVTLKLPRGSLAYQGLAATDERGRPLPARLELHGGTLLIRVDDRGARYPVTVDPLVQQARLTASDGAAGDQFGLSVAVSGDGGTVAAGVPYATVGANEDQGAVYVFTKPASGWASETQAAKLTASDGTAGDSLGWSVAVSGDGGTVAAGVPGAAVGANQEQGAVYVFARPASGWASETQRAELTAPVGAGDQVGFSVAVSGDGSTVAAGAPSTAVYVFTRPASGWARETQAAKLTHPDAGGQVGWSVAVSGDGSTVAAGVPFAAAGPNEAPGAVYVFTRPASGWASETQAAKLTASDGATGNWLGFSVAVSGDGGTVAAGAPYATVSVNAQRAVYVFTRPGIRLGQRDPGGQADRLRRRRRRPARLVGGGLR